jgi:hypothetical protein
MRHLDAPLAQRLIRGQLAPAEKAHWERHILRCTRCREVVGAERAVMAILGVDPAPLTMPLPEVYDVLARVPGLRPDAAARRRLRALQLAGLLTVAALTLLLGWQIHRLPADAAAGRTEARMAPELEQNLVSNWPALAALRTDPWLLDHYEAVLTLEQLLRRHQP